MNAAILTEGGEKQGFGHLSRCSALAQAFDQFHIPVRIFLNGDHAALKTISKKIEVQITDWHKNAVPELWAGSEIVVIDSYEASPQLYMKAYENFDVVLFFDDFNRIKYPGGLIITNKIPQDTERNEKLVYLTGNNFLPVRNAFRARGDYQVRDPIQNVMVSLGGGNIKTEHFEMIISVVESLLPKTGIHILTGKIGPINKIPKSNIFYHCGLNEQELYDLFMKMDLAITSGGVIINELATCGVPAIAIRQADNQVNNINNLLMQGLIGYAGEIGSKKFIGNLEEQVLSFKDLSRRKEIHDRCISALDGKGAINIVKAALKHYFQKNLIIRKATISDSENILDLSNDPEVRSQSFSSHQIASKEHEDWYRKTLNNADIFFLIAEIKNNFAGQIRFEIGDQSAAVSLSVHSRYRGTGIAYMMMYNAIQHLSLSHPHIRHIIALIKRTNAKSMNYFKACGFKFVKDLKFGDIPAAEYKLEI